MLVSEVIDRTYSEWLEPGGINRPPWDEVVNVGTALGGVGEGTFTGSGRITLPAEGIAEIDDELILFTGAAATYTTKGRGWRESTPTTHAVGAKIYIDNKFPRIIVFDALKNIMQRLYPKGLYRRVTNASFNYDTRQVQALDSGVLDVLSVIVRKPGTYEQYTSPLVEGRDYRILWEFTPPKIQMLRGGFGTAQYAVTVIAKKDFTQPTATSDDLDTLGVPASLQPSLPMAVAGWLLQGREIPRVQIEAIQRFIAAQGVQVGSALNVGQALLNQFFNGPVADERRRQFEMDPTRISLERSI